MISRQARRVLRHAFAEAAIIFGIAAASGVIMLAALFALAGVPHG